MKVNLYKREIRFYGNDKEFNKMIENININKKYRAGVCLMNKNMKMELIDFEINDAQM